MLVFIMTQSSKLHHCQNPKKRKNLIICNISNIKKRQIPKKSFPSILFLSIFLPSTYKQIVNRKSSFYDYLWLSKEKIKGSSGGWGGEKFSKEVVMRINGGFFSKHKSFYFSFGHVFFDFAAAACFPDNMNIWSCIYWLNVVYNFD